HVDRADDSAGTFWRAAPNTDPFLKCVPPAEIRCGVRSAALLHCPGVSERARSLGVSMILPEVSLQMKMGTGSTDGTAAGNWGLDKGPLPCVGEGRCARPAARHIDGARAAGGVVTRVWTSHR